MVLPAATDVPASNRRGRRSVDAVAALTVEELDALLGHTQALGVAAVIDWMMRSSRAVQLPTEVIPELCERLVALGLPLDRYGSAVETLDAAHDAIGRLWVRGQGVTERIYVRPDGTAEPEDDSAYRRSPYYRAASTSRWVELWLPDTDDAEFDIVPELKQDGFVHYLCVPVFLINGTHGWTTFATRRETGFSTLDVALIARIMPALAMVIDFRSTWVALQTLLRTYVGEEPQQAILRGNTKRGQVSTIRSAMLFADMRDSVGHTADLGAAEAVQVFNTLFDCLVPSIEARNGEVLKYIGDGLLAIFRESANRASCNAAERALLAGEDALRAIKAHNAAHPDERPFHVGIALHYGEAAYGNVGSGVRLDFTVIGRDVGLASRLAGMNRALGEPLLMSAAFTARLRHRALRLGAFEARGFREPLEVFRPDDSRRAVD